MHHIVVTDREIYNRPRTAPSTCRFAPSGQESLALSGREPPDRFPDRDPGGAVHPRRDPVRHEVRVLLRGLPQNPADGLADEELTLREHAVGVAGEPLPVSELTAAQRH